MSHQAGVSLLNCFCYMQHFPFTQVFLSPGKAIIRAVLQKLYPPPQWFCQWSTNWFFERVAYTTGMVLLLVRWWIRTVGVQGSPKGMGIRSCSPCWLTAWEWPKDQVHWFPDCHDNCTQVTEGGCEIQHKLPWVPLISMLYCFTNSWRSVFHFVGLGPCCRSFHPLVISPTTSSRMSRNDCNS